MIAGIVVLLAACCAFSMSSTGDALVVYCAHDSIYSEQLLRQFEEETGIDLAIRFDTEATKSLGLVNLLLREREHPRCDVFWNNELLGMLDLQDAGVLQPYKGLGYERVPHQYKDQDGHWTGFGGRLRVWIVNQDAIPTEQNLKQLPLDEWVSKDAQNMVFANPLYGTTRTHFTVLWHLRSEAQLSRWHRDLIDRGAMAVQGNAMVKNMVAAGTKELGWTDTDDYFVAADAGKPVKLAPIRLQSGETICIPNTVAIIRGTQRLEAAQQLVEYLLSSETELALSKSKSRQIPLGDCNEKLLSEEVQQLRDWALESYDLRKIASSREACLRWLKAEYLQ